MTTTPGIMSIGGAGGRLCCRSSRTPQDEKNSPEPKIGAESNCRKNSPLATLKATALEETQVPTLHTICCVCNRYFDCLFRVAGGLRGAYLRLCVVLVCRQRFPVQVLCFPNQVLVTSHAQHKSTQLHMQRACNDERANRLGAGRRPLVTCAKRGAASAHARISRARARLAVDERRRKCTQETKRRAVGFM